MKFGARPRYATVVFDVDSTLASIEGIDWLAERRGPEVARECADLTGRAMAGELPIEAVYLRRLEKIAPSAMDIAALSEAYARALQPGAATVIEAVHDAQCDVHIVSGGLREAIVPMARELGVPARRVHAVSVVANADGKFVRLDGPQPLATQQGKPLVLSALALTRPIVMIGDGSTDAATRGVVDTFIAYTAVVRRKAVVGLADAEAKDMQALQRLLFEQDT